MKTSMRRTELPIVTSASSTVLLQSMPYGEQAEHLLQATFAATGDLRLSKVIGNM
jgi:hypothetical protein